MRAASTTPSQRQALAAHDVHPVQLPLSPQHPKLTHGSLQIMTPAEYGNFKAQLKAREDGDWKRVEWSLARRPLLHELEVVHGRMIAPNPKVCDMPCRALTKNN